MSIKVSKIDKIFHTNNGVLSSKSVILFKNASLNISSDSFILLNGRNGSGKTTLLKIIADLVKPDSGEVIFENNISIKDVTLCSSNERSLFWRLSVKENFHFFSNLYNVKVNENKELDLLNRFNMGPSYHQKVSSLSHGQKKIILFIISILKNSKIYLFDEILNGIDVHNSKIIKSYIKENLIKHAAIIWVSHQEDEFRNSTKSSYLIENNTLKKVHD